MEMLYFILEWFAIFGAPALILPVSNYVRKRRGFQYLPVFYAKVAVLVVMAIPYVIFKAWEKSTAR